MNTPSLSPVINFLWAVADDVLVNVYQKGKYKDVILPILPIPASTSLIRDSQ